MSDTSPAPLVQDYSLGEVAAALGMSTRWVRDRISKDGAEHQRYGHKIRFTPEQVEKLRASHVGTPKLKSVTTGSKRKRSGK